MNGKISLNQLKKQQHDRSSFDYFGKKTLLKILHTIRISDFILYCSKEKGNENGGTINRKLSAISKILKQARKERKISYMPDIDKLERNLLVEKDGLLKKKPKLS